MSNGEGKPVRQKPSLPHTSPLKTPPSKKLAKLKPDLKEGQAKTVTHDLHNVLKELDKEQLKVIQHIKGPALVVAGPGSGKTRTGTAWVIEMIARGVDPRNIMAITFTKRAAGELCDRIQKKFGKNPVREGMFAGTFHHVANQYIKQYRNVFGLASNYTILDDDDSTRLYKKVVNELIDKIVDKYIEKMNAEDINRHKIDKNERKAISRSFQQKYPNAASIKGLYSNARNRRKRVEALDEFRELEETQQKFVQQAIILYESRKKDYLALDFEDLLLKFVELLNTNGVRDEIIRQTRYLLVDEYQDVNPLQTAIAQILGDRADALLMVGDDAQTIYSFMGAGVERFLKADRDFSEHVLTYKLNNDYRNSPEIIACANELIAHNKRQIKKKLIPINPSGPEPLFKELRNPEEEAEFIIQQVMNLRDNHGVKLKDQAILFRDRYHYKALEEELLANKIPYDLQIGVDFLERKQIKDLVCFLAIIYNDQNLQAWERVFELHEGIAKKTSSGLIRYLKKRDALMPANPLDKFLQTRNFKNAIAGARITEQASASFIQLQKILRSLKQENKAGIKFDDLLKFAATYYMPILKMKREFKEDSEDRINEINLFIDAMQTYDTLEDFFSNYAISQTMFEKKSPGDHNKNSDRIIVTTVHQAKGLEWDAVHVLAMNEEIFPSSRSETEAAIEEERRVFYVAITRAMRWLTITWTKERPSIDFRSMLPSKPSRFIEECSS